MTVRAMLVLALSLGGAALAAAPGNDGNFPTVPKVSMPPSVDGDLGDAAWKGAFRVTLEQRAQGKKTPAQPCEPCEAWVVCDEQNFYVAFRATESKSPYLSTKKPVKRGGRVFGHPQYVMDSDYVCFLLDPGHYGFYDYYLFYIAPDGELYATAAWPMHPNSQEDLYAPAYKVGFQAAAKLEHGKVWTAELVVPFKDILRHPQEGMIDTIGMNFRRMQWGAQAGKVNNDQAWNLVMCRGESQKHFKHIRSWQPYKSWESWMLEGETGWANVAYPEEFGLVRVAAGTRTAELARGHEKMFEIPYEFTWQKLKMADYFDKPRMPRRDDLRPDNFEAGEPKLFDGGVPDLKPAAFKSKPAVEAQSGKATIRFELAAPADLAVAIVDSHGKVVRHLAHGLLCENPPAPLKPGLAQSLSWDYTDDLGKPASGSDFKVRVMAGLKPEFVRSMDFKIRKCDKPTWPEMLDAENLANPQPKPNKHDHGGGGGRLPALNRFTNELYLPGYEVYDASSGEKKRTFTWRQPIATAIALTSNGELAFAPDGHMYIAAINHLFKADAQGKPVAFASLGRTYVPNLFRGHSNPHRGHAIGPDGDTYFIHHYMGHGNANSQVTRIAADGRFRQFGLINLPGISAAGVKVDREGFVYVGCTLNPRDRAIPPDLRRLPEGVQKLYRLTYGSIVRFKPTGGRVVWRKEGEESAVTAARHGQGYRQFALKLEGAAWVHPGYSQVVSRARGDSPVACVCQNARFELDAFGRLFVPDAIAGRVKVMDTNGNAIRYIGQRGSRLEGLGFRWPSSVVANDEYCHIQDYLHSKSVQVRLGYEAVEEAAIAK